MAQPQRKQIRTNIDWKPQPRQLKFLRACGLAHPFDKDKPKAPVAKVVGYGGSAGGGKSDALLAAGIIACLTHLGCRVGYFRRQYTQLEGPGGAIMRSFELLSGALGPKAYNGKLRRWNFPGGGMLQFCYLDREDAVFNYQSQQFDVLLFDEATQFSWSMITYMQTRIRASKDGIVTFTAMASNPGNIGHSWFKSGFVSAGEPEMPHNVEVEEGKYQTHIFIPAKLSDNLILEKRDPTYRQNLENQPELIRRQLLEGDWDVAEGLAFSEWRASRHVCEPFAIDDNFILFRSLDWGFSKPYHVGWYAIDHDGRMWMYRELYGWGGKPDVGTREDPEDVARKIMEMEMRPDGTREPIRYAVADDAVFGSRQDNSPTIGEQFNVAFGHRATHWQPVGKGPRSRVAGKLELHHRLKWKEADTQPPMLVIFNTCRHIIRTLPNLVLDDDDPEDVNCWAAGTLISTPSGDVPIEQVKSGDLVDTPIGPRRVIKSHVSGLSETIRVELSNGQILQGTPNHKIGVENIGLVQLADLKLRQTLVWRNKGWKRNLLYITALSIHAMKAADTTTQTALISPKGIRHCIGRFGLMLDARFRLIITSIIKTTTTMITGSTTMNVCHQANMQNYTTGNGRSHYSEHYGNGELPTKGVNSFGAMLQKCTKIRRNVNLRASIVAAYLLPKNLRRSIVPKPVAKLCKALIQHVKSVVSRFVSSPMRRNKCEPVHIVAVGRCAERIPVFNLTVEEAHLFYANGVLSSNTDLEDHAYDSVRYACMSRPMIPKKPKNEPTKIEAHKKRIMKQRQGHIRIV